MPHLGDVLLVEGMSIDNHGTLLIVPELFTGLPAIVALQTR
jgi:hypothetical protein